MAQENASLFHSKHCLTTWFPHWQYREFARSLFIGQFFSYFFRCFFVLPNGFETKNGRWIVFGCLFGLRSDLIWFTRFWFVFVAFFFLHWLLSLNISVYSWNGGDTGSFRAIEVEIFVFEAKLSSSESIRVLLGEEFFISGTTPFWINSCSLNLTEFSELVSS